MSLRKKATVGLGASVVTHKYFLPAKYVLSCICYHLIMAFPSDSFQSFHNGNVINRGASVGVERDIFHV